MSFFDKKCNYTKLRSNLRLCSSRMELLCKKKQELNVRARREISELLKESKFERARIRTEHVIREDYVVEVFEILQTYTQLLCVRFEMFQATKEVDPSLEEAIATLIWCAGRLGTEVGELKEIRQLFAHKYSKEYMDACTQNILKKVNPKIMQKLNITAPPPSLVEMYLIEIAKTYKIEYEPNVAILNSGEDMNLVEEGLGFGRGELIDFEADKSSVSPNPPNLPAEFGKPEEAWLYSGQVGSEQPYPDQPMFPTPESAAAASLDPTAAPPLPTEPPVAFNSSLNAPPPYEPMEYKPTNQPTVSGEDEHNATSDDQTTEDLEKRFQDLINRP